MDLFMYCSFVASYTDTQYTSSFKFSFVMFMSMLKVLFIFSCILINSTFTYFIFLVNVVNRILFCVMYTILINCDLNVLRSVYEFCILLPYEWSVYLQWLLVGSLGFTAILPAN